MSCQEKFFEDGKPVWRDCTTGRQTSPPVPSIAAGPGHELKKLLAGWPLRITSSSNCSCNAHARRMDEMGCDWCAANVPTITEWMRGEAAKRKLPFIATLAGLMVKRAIHNARKEASKHGTKENAGGEAV